MSAPSKLTFADRYRAAGLTHNPFSTTAAQTRDESFVDRGIPDPVGPGRRSFVQVIGESGLGKSTQLDHWRLSAPGPYHYIVRAPYRLRWHRPPDVGDGLVYGDEIDRMPLPLRRRWFRQLAASGATLIIGTHEDLSRLARSTGFVEVRTHYLSPLNHGQLSEMLSRRLQSAAFGEDYVRFDAGEVEEILDLSRGVPRDAEVAAHAALARIVGGRSRPGRSI